MEEGKLSPASQLRTSVYGWLRSARENMLSDEKPVSLQTAAIHTEIIRNEVMKVLTRTQGLRTIKNGMLKVSLNHSSSIINFHGFTSQNNGDGSERGGV